MNTLEKIKKHHKNKTCCSVFRSVDGQSVDSVNGYIVDYAKEFLIVLETHNFLLEGFKIIPIEFIDKVRYNRFDKCYDQIMRSEKVWDDIAYTHRVNLASWSTIFTSIQNLGLNVIIENEHENEGTFDIGPITKVTENYVRVRNFNAAGILNEKDTKFKWKHITLVNFDDRYINVFSKYLREQGTMEN